MKRCCDHPHRINPLVLVMKWIIKVAKVVDFKCRGQIWWLKSDLHPQILFLFFFFLLGSVKETHAAGIWPWTQTAGWVHRNCEVRKTLGPIREWELHWKRTYSYGFRCSPNSLGQKVKDILQESRIISAHSEHLIWIKPVGKLSLTRLWRRGASLQFLVASLTGWSSSVVFSHRLGSFYLLVVSVHAHGTCKHVVTEVVFPTGRPADFLSDVWARSLRALVTVCQQVLR